MRRIYVLDTNILLSDPNSIYSFKNNDVIIPFQVLQELDKKKTVQTTVGANARQVIRTLDSYRTKKGLSAGTRIGPRLGLISVKDCSSPLPGNADNKIISVALEAQKQYPERKVVVVSRDIAVRVKCDSLGLSAENYQTDKAIDKREHIYSGFTTCLVDDQVVDSFYNKNPIYLSKDAYKLYPNQFIMLISSQQQTKSAIARFIDYNTPLRRISDFKQGIFALKPRNKEQQFALDLLMDPKVFVATMTGLPGSGKTLCAIAAGLEQTFGKGKQYKRLVIVRPVIPLGKDIGFLPGTIQEKMEPYIAPIVDQLRFLFGNDRTMLDEYIKNGIIEIEAMTYIRGRSISDAYILLDEAQNLTTHEIKTILTRVGDNTKIVITGDLGQIDNFYINETTSGLTNVVEKMKTQEIAGHITLQKGERSIVATVSSKIL